MGSCCDCSIHAGCFKALVSMGSLRRRLPVAANTALVTAGTLGELPHQGLESIQRLHVTNELRRQLLMFYDGLRDPFPQRVCKEAIPRSPTCALQIDDSNFAVGRLQI